MSLSSLHTHVQRLVDTYGWDLVEVRVPAGRSDELLPWPLRRTAEDWAAGRPGNLRLAEDRRLKGDQVTGKLANRSVIQS
jgi:uncharacterized protein (DUF2132 family)